MSSAEDSPARASAMPVSSLGLPIHARVFGQSSPVLSAKFDPITSSWRMLQLSVDGGSDEFSETWPRSGMTQSGTAYQLLPLAPLTGGTASGSWPTPHGICQPGPRRPGPSGNELGRAVNARMWPTPNASKVANDITLQVSGDGRTKPNKLGWAGAEREQWPIPNARDYKGAPGAGSRERGGHQASLPGSVKDSEGSGSLNPRWVEWLMGFPSGWTDLEVSETPSSRRSPSGSESESLPTRTRG